DGDDRARLRRADRARAPYGVRAGAQPPHRAADGRGRRLMSSPQTAPGSPGAENRTDPSEAVEPTAAADEGAAERAALAGELFAPGVGAQAGPPRTPAPATQAPPGAPPAGR